MTRTKELLARISVDPQICFGKPCIKGTRIWVSLIVDMVATGVTHEQILGDYPTLTEKDIRAALFFASETARGRYFDVPIKAPA